MPHSVAGARSAKENVLFLGYRLEWNVPKETVQSSCPITSSDLHFNPQTNPDQADTTMLRVLSYVGEATPGKRLPLNSPPTGDSESRGLFKGFPAERAHALQCTGLG